VRVGSNKVEIVLCEATIPELLGEDGQRAACWLLTEEGRKRAAS